MLPIDWDVLVASSLFSSLWPPSEGYLTQTKDTVAAHKNRPTNDSVLFVHMQVFLTSHSDVYYTLRIRFNNRDSNSGHLDSWSDGKNPWEEMENERGHGADDICISNLFIWNVHLDRIRRIQERRWRAEDMRRSMPARMNAELVRPGQKIFGFMIRHHKCK